MRISLIGCGRWGTFIAWYLSSQAKADVLLYGRESSKRMNELMETRRNSYLVLPPGVKLTTSESDLATHADIVVISVSSQSLRGVLTSMKSLEGKKLVLCMKGIEIESGKRLTEVASECGFDDVAIWVGPGHVQDFLRGCPNCMVIDSTNPKLTSLLVSTFDSDLIRFYYGSDLVGNEIGAAAKNVVGIAAGILDGMGLSALKGALMSRGAREIGRLIAAMGGDEITAYGLAHLGDYEATVFSPHSHNRRYGEAFAKNEPLDMGLAEGVYTVKALLALSDKYSVELPISDMVYGIIHEGVPVREALTQLFAREQKSE